MDRKESLLTGTT